MELRFRSRAAENAAHPSAYANVATAESEFKRFAIPYAQDQAEAETCSSRSP
jgi:hypothetical protein